MEKPPLPFLMRNHWIDERTIEPDEHAPERGRNPDSSVAAQYEDSVLPDADEEYEPS